MKGIATYRDARALVQDLSQDELRFIARHSLPERGLQIVLKARGITGDTSMTAAEARAIAAATDEQRASIAADVAAAPPLSAAAIDVLRSTGFPGCPLTTKGSVKQDMDRGTWFFVVDLPGTVGRRQVKRRGFPTKAAALAAMDHLLRREPERRSSLEQRAAAIAIGMLIDDDANPEGLYQEVLDELLEQEADERAIAEYRRIGMEDWFL